MRYQLNEGITSSIQKSTKRMRFSNKRKNHPKQNKLNTRKEGIKKRYEAVHIKKQVGKGIRRDISRDIRKLGTKIVLDTIEENTNMRIVRTVQRETTNDKIEKQETYSADEITMNIEDFYTELYISHELELSLKIKRFWMWNLKKLSKYPQR